MWRILLFCCEWAAAIAGFVAWGQVKNTRYKYFVVYLFFIAIGDPLTHYIGKNNYIVTHHILYNWLIIPIEFLFFYWFYYWHLSKPLHKQCCLVFSVGSIIVRVLEFTVWKGEAFLFSSLSYLVSSIFLIAVVLMYLLQFMRSDNIIHYHRHFAFWVTIGVLVFYIGSFPFSAFYNYLLSEERPFFNAYWKVQISLGMLMYLIFSFAFIWTGIKRKYLFS
jgi:hypothetical protein